MAKTAQEELDDFKDTAKKEAEKIIKDEFPQKVLELNKLLLCDKLQMSRISEIHTELHIPEPTPGAQINGESSEQAKKRKLDSVLGSGDGGGTAVYTLPLGTVPCNEHIQQIITLVKPHVLGLIDSCNKIKMWIAYSIPRIEDGNNFGVSVQEDSMSEARQVESEAATYLDQISRYYTTRGKIISKVAKYPHIADYRQAVLELDEKQFLSMRLIVTELRNQYASLHDLILKNFDKITKPRSSNSDNLY